MQCNIYESIKGIFEINIELKQSLPETTVRNYMYQTLKAIDHMHRNNIFHRDIKP